jgi:hypothetical protein
MKGGKLYERPSLDHPEHLSTSFTLARIAVPRHASASERTVQAKLIVHQPWTLHRHTTSLHTIIYAYKTDLSLGY